MNARWPQSYTKGIEPESGTVSIAASKCKLAPLSQKSIPRLELQAAVLGIRLAEMITSAASVTYTKVTFWSLQHTLVDHETRTPRKSPQSPMTGTKKGESTFGYKAPRS